VYCGAALPGESVEAAAAAARRAAAAEAEPAAEDVVLVLDLRSGDSAGLARALGLPAWEAGQRARRGGYQLQRVGSRAEAEAEAGRLAAAGLTVLSLPGADVRAAARPVAAAAGRRREAALELRLDDRRRVALAAADVLLVVEGPIVRQRQVGEPRQRTLILGIPRRWDDLTRTPGHRLHVHRRSSPQPIELDAEGFEFEERPPVGGPLGQLRAWLGELAPAAPRDDAFAALPPALAPAEPAGDRIRSALGRPQPRAAGPMLLDNLAQFRFYSAWRGCVERRVRAGREADEG
jgi:hypothetical protein